MSTPLPRGVARGFAIQHKGVIYEIDDWSNDMPVKLSPGYKYLAGEQEVVFSSQPPASEKCW